ncbi:MAG: response regulator [Cellvibrionaceae bacterium]
MTLSRILIVDDSEADQFLCEYAIEHYDPAIEVKKVFDGKEALDFIENAENDVDIIFLDINMPGMNGFDFLEIYKNYDGDNKAKIIMLTSSVESEDYERCMQYDEVEQFLSKPLHMDKIGEFLKLH